MLSGLCRRRGGVATLLLKQSLEEEGDRSRDAPLADLPPRHGDAAHLQDVGEPLLGESQAPPHGFELLWGHASYVSCGYTYVHRV